jgi:hypothetical protein
MLRTLAAAISGPQSKGGKRKVKALNLDTKYERTGQKIPKNVPRFFSVPTRGAQQ